MWYAQSMPRWLWDCSGNEFCWLTLFLLECHISTRLAFQDLGWYFGCWHWALDMFPSYCLHQWKHMAFTMWECDVIHLPASPCFCFSHRPPHQRDSICLACLITAHFRFMDNSCNSIHGQIYPLIPSPSIGCISSFLAGSVMGSPS